MRNFPKSISSNRCESPRMVSVTELNSTSKEVAGNRTVGIPNVNTNTNINDASSVDISEI